MKLNELLEIQRELNSRIKDVPSKEDWEMALLCEIGELCDSLRDGMIAMVLPGRPGWVWWKRADRKPDPSSRQKVLEELADILHFALCGRILGFIEFTEEQLSLFWELGWESKDLNSSLSVALRSICCLQGDFIYEHLPKAALCLGFSRREVEEAYQAKASKNKERWKEAEMLLSQNQGITVDEAQRRKKALEGGLNWLRTYIAGLPELVKYTLRALEEDWQKELMELENRLKKALNLPLPKL